MVRCREEGEGRDGEMREGGEVEGRKVRGEHDGCVAEKLDGGTTDAGRGGRCGSRDDGIKAELAEVGAELLGKQDGATVDAAALKGELP